MKKILFVITQLYAGGAEKSLVNLLKNLDSKKYNIDLLVMNQNSGNTAHSLMPEIPKWVRVCNAFENNRHLTLLKKVRRKLYYKPEEKELFYVSAMDFVRNKEYDWAFHVGEWSSPKFVAEKVNSKKKAVWVHSDLNMAEYFDDQFFSYDGYFDNYIFVSQNSLEQGCKKYKFLAEKSCVIHNINNIMEIKEKSQLEIIEPSVIAENKVTLLTVGNIRPPKNHLKQICVMKKLKEKGIDVRWWNIGATADIGLVKKVRDAIQENGLEDDFLIMGARDNPYPYMKYADIITSLSDYESWSMVITEAKALGKTIIATKTSGAIEQIEDGQTGFLTGFDVDEIVKTIIHVISNNKQREYVQRALENFDETEAVIKQFDAFVNAETVKNEEFDVLYVIDDVNYAGGAHSATLKQIEYLVERGLKIAIFTGAGPNVEIREKVPKVKFYGWNDIDANVLFNRRLADCLTDKNLKSNQKKYKLRMSKASKLNRNCNVFETFVLNETSRFFSKFNTVCVMSEASSFKKGVADSLAKNKIQWIHTDYCAWVSQTDFGRSQEEGNRCCWNKFNKIVCLSEKIRNNMVNKYPEIADKVEVIPNIIPVESIKTLSQKKGGKKDFPKVNFITVCRFGREKKIPELLEILQELSEEGYDFSWTFIGDGEELSRCIDISKQSGMSEKVFFLGQKKNPYPYLKKADVFGLFSEYEGLPNTIYEALTLGVPVCATNVGAISDQVIPEKTGWLISGGSKDIADCLKHIMEHQEEIANIKCLLQGYKYDNGDIKQAMDRLFID